jgi:prophage regulatory protein
MIIRMNSRRDKDGNIVVPGVADRVGLHPVVIRRMVRKDKFPKPVSLGPRAKGWIDAELEEWEEQRRQERDAAVKEDAA